MRTPIEVSEEIIGLQHEIWQAIIAKDFDHLQQIYPDNYLFRHTGGVFQTVAEYFSNIKNGVYQYYSYLPITESVRLVNDRQAILSVIAKTDAQIYGFRKIWTMEFDLLFEKSNGKWRPANET